LFHIFYFIDALYFIDFTTFTVDLIIHDNVLSLLKRLTPIWNFLILRSFVKLNPPKPSVINRDCPG